jgi:uncharacterized Ntn-hydrolase superfamily protein
VTFSIVAADVETGELGVATQSKFLAVGAVVPWARAGVGAVATQSFAEVTFGPRGLDLLAEGVRPVLALEQLLAEDPDREQRQVGIVDAAGRAASFTGTKCLEFAASVMGEGYACQGNILASAEVVPAMAEAFEGSSGRLANRLLEALRAAQNAGGDRRGQESAALLVVKEGGGYGGRNDRYIDLRVDHHAEPIEELSQLVSLHSLYFDRPRDDELLDVDQAQAEEIARLLRGLGSIGPGQDVWDALEAYVAVENLEERWIGPGRVDPRVIDYLRKAASGD